MLDGKFELNPQRRPIWVQLELYLTPKRYHLKWKGLITNSSIGKGSTIVDQTRETRAN